MLELYVIIADEGVLPGFNYGQPQAKVAGIKLDTIYEEANEKRLFFEQIGFKRGLAILDYIQAIRQAVKFKKLNTYKDMIKQSALKFKDVHDICGIQQCLTSTKKYLVIKPPMDPEKMESYNKVYDVLREHLSSLEDTEDEKIKRFCKFR